MNCNKVSNLLSPYMDGELLGFEHRLIHQHISRCAECSAEYEELLHMKRLLAAMRLHEPSRSLAPSIVQRVSQAAEQTSSVGLGDWRMTIPNLRSRPQFYSPMIGLGVGIGFFGLLLWAHPTSQVGATEGSHRSLVFELANLTQDEPAPHVSDLTNGLMREAAPRPVSFERRYPVDLPDFPASVRRQRPMSSGFTTTAIYR